MNYNNENDQDGLRLTEQLKHAVRSEAMPPYLEARIRNTIQSNARKSSMMRWLVPASAALLVCVGVTIAYQLGNLRITAASQEAYNGHVTNQVATIMRVGLGDHIHCAFFRKYPKNAPNVQDLAKSLGPEYSPLIPILRKHVPEDCVLMAAHECRYHGRKFVHLSMKGGSGLVSLLIARKGDGESFKTESLIPALVQSGIPIYRTGVQRFQVASFESRDHLVYFISDMGQQHNTDMMVAIAPQVKQLLANLEG